MRISALFIITVLASCGGVATADPDSYTVVDSAGIQIVESLSPVWGEGTRRIDPEPLLRIGREEEGPYQFSFLAEGLLLADGSIVIPEFQAQEVRIFDPAGRHVRTFGQRGEGPGEFGNLSGVFEYPGDSLAAYDGRLYRTTIFSRSSDSYRVISNQVEGNFYAFGLMRGGLFLLFDPGRGFRPDLPAGLQWTHTDIVAMDPSDGASRVIATLPSREQLVLPGGDTERMIPPRWSIQAVADDGFYWATSDRYQIGFYDGDGQLRRIVRRPVEPRAVEPSTIEEYVEANLELVRSREGEGAVASYRRSFEEAHYGEHVPVFGSAFVDADQRLWVSGPVWPSLQGPPRQWSVFSREGVWLGDLEAPEGVRIVHCRGDRVLGIWLDELDVPYVQVHRLVGE